MGIADTSLEVYALQIFKEGRLGNSCTISMGVQNGRHFQFKTCLTLTFRPINNYNYAIVG